MKENRVFKEIAHNEIERDEIAEFCVEPQHFMMVTTAGKPIFSK